MHLTGITLYPERYPDPGLYPFRLPLFQRTRCVDFTTPVTFFLGENGTGKSTLLEAVARRCGMHIWRDDSLLRVRHNPWETRLCEFLDVAWADGPVPGSFFGADIFRNFAQLIDEWAASDPGQLAYFGGESLMTQSHGQSLMAFFRSQYRLRGLFFLDEPEGALSPRTQIELVELLAGMGEAGRAQFLVATHSPILITCPGATILSFDDVPLRAVRYEETVHFRTYKDFLERASEDPDRVRAAKRP